ncbi:unnamed protein product [Mytilus coruscus]|uniref:Uncharacterized protein n=1 Tax=Mytilus coruscus TaxID=42192 RepID=A0A6J8F1W1_MYTCO|nr:unnamed protein product [Mytilus coruscus]
MIPKLTAFYHNALLPELVSPRYNKYPGIREPGIWYTEVPYLGSTSSQQTSGKVKTRRRKPLTVESDTEIDEAVVKTTSKVAKRSKRKCSGPKFVGREILHEWVEENNRKWYKGRVISVIQNKDGDKDAVYEVLYEDCDEPYEIDHLLEDFTNSSLKLIDL